MLKPATLLLTVLVLVLPFSVGADDRPVMEGPDLSSLPEAPLSADSLVHRQTNKVLTRLRKLDPALAAKVEKKLKDMPNLRERTVYALKRIAKIDEKIDLSELSYKKGIGSKDILSNNINIRSIIMLLYWNSMPYYENALGKSKPEYFKFDRIVSEWFRKYSATRAKRRKRLGLHKVVGKTGPPKPVKSKPKETPGSKPDKTCSESSLIGNLDCVEVLIDK